MIDIHSHLLPGLDDGAADMAMTVKMAEMAYADGIRGMICTPHITPGVYDNTTTVIVETAKQVRLELEKRNIGLVLFTGADVHIAPDLKSRFDKGDVPTLAKSRYFLFEPSHHVLTPRIDALAIGLIEAGFIPILTHPERLSWIATHYEMVERLNQVGCLIQITAGSITGDFGKHAQYYAEKLIDEGRVDIIATDTHDPVHRPPVLSRARDLMVTRVGADEAIAMVAKRPMGILLNTPMKPVGQDMGAMPDRGNDDVAPAKRRGLFERLTKGTQV